MAAGPVQYKRKYELWILILLVIVCWPIAIVYYFTRPEVPVQELYQPQYGQQQYAQPQYPQQQYPPQAYAPQTSPAPQTAPAAAGTPTCPRCGRPATWVAQYNRWYCYTDQQYL
jgi:hypothetical protein